MKAFLALLPPWVPLALLGILLAGATVGYFGWRHVQREIGAAQIEAQNARAIAQQREEDAALSASIIAKQQAALSALEAKANTAIQQVYREPITTSCAQSPSMRAATRGVHDIIGGGAPPSGRGAPAALH